MKRIASLSTFLSMLLLTSCGGQIHEHTFETSWSKDSENHWHAATCEHTEFTEGLAKHVDSDNNGVCDVCEYEFPVVPEPHEHTFETAWSKDSVNHWHAATCEHTDLTKNLGKHVDDDENGVCDVCDYVYPEIPATKYSFKFIGFNCSLNNEDTYVEGTSVDLTFTVDEGYALEEVITVLGNDAYEYDIEEKTLSLEINDDITVVAHAFKIEEEATPSLGDAYYEMSPDYTNYKTEEHQGEYHIASHSLIIGNQCWQTYLVYDGVKEECEEKGIEVWKTFEDAEAKTQPDYKCEYSDFEKRLDDRFDKYILKDLSFINLVDTIYARTYFIKDGVKTYGDIDEWSMLKSCHEHYNSGQSYEYGDGQIVPSYVVYGYEIIRSTIEYASQLQTCFDYKKDHLARNEIYKYGLAHTDNYQGERILFTNVQQISDFFDDNNNCFGDLTLTFDMPCHVGSIDTSLDWTHSISIETKSSEVEIDTINVYSHLTVEDLKVGYIISGGTIIGLWNTIVNQLSISDSQIEVFDSTVHFATLLSCTPVNFRNTKFTKVESSDRISFNDCGVVTLENCIIENEKIQLKDTWSNYNDKDCIFTIKGYNTIITNSVFDFMLTRSGSTITITDEIYADGTSFNSTGNTVEILDGCYKDCTFNNVVIFYGFFNTDPENAGADIDSDSNLVVGHFELPDGTFIFWVSNEE